LIQSPDGHRPLDHQDFRVKIFRQSLANRGGYVTGILAVATQFFDYIAQGHAGPNDTARSASGTMPNKLAEAMAPALPTSKRLRLRLAGWVSRGDILIIFPFCFS